MDRPNNASYSLGVARFNVNGSLDTSFNSGASFSSSAGYVTDGTGNGIGCGMALQPNGSLIVAGGVSDSSNPLVPSYVPVVARLTAGDVGGEQVRVDNASPALPLIGAGQRWPPANLTRSLRFPSPFGRGRRVRAMNLAPEPTSRILSIGATAPTRRRLPPTIWPPPATR